MLDSPRIIATSGFSGYELLDSGDGRKLERFGRYIFDRPEAQAVWSKKLSEVDWQRADAVFTGAKEEEDGEASEKGRWRTERQLPQTWPVSIDCESGPKVSVLCRLMSFRHLGLFPEQIVHWNWMFEQLQRVGTARGGERPRVLNLFGYTGAATLVAARAGADVVHVDASKRAIGWARENQETSNLGTAPVRWICDDARKFVAREIRRGRRYDIILVDPPKFGRGPGGEVWDLFSDLPALLSDCNRLLSEEQSGLVLTVYAIRASTVTFRQLVGECLGQRAGQFDYGELVIFPRVPGNGIATSHFTRWWSR